MNLPDDPIVTNVYLDIKRAVAATDAQWSVIGGQALRAHGVPRNTLDVDALVDADSVMKVAESLVDTFCWQPVSYDEATGDFVDVDDIATHTMDDPVLFDMQDERLMIPLRSPLGLLVDLLSAQHPVERDMMNCAIVMVRSGVPVPISPLGGVLLVKTKADRPKDVAAIEQTAEHLPAERVKEAVAWARQRDPATADDLEALIAAARARRAPVRTTPNRRRQ